MARIGVRSEWSSTPASVRAAVDDVLGSPVVVTTPLKGGFSPGPAVRAELADGRFVFVKAAGTALNPVSPSMHRREAAVLRGLAPDVPAPRLLGVVDDGDWVAVAVEWVDGRQPDASVPGDVQRLLALLARLTASPVADGRAPIEPFATAHAGLLGHWQVLASDPPGTLDAWSRVHLDRLAAVDAQAADATVGDHLVHGDVRTDNALLARDDRGRDVLVDWPCASRGAPWLDVVGLLPALHLDGGPRPAEAFAASGAGHAADQAAVDAFVVALAGYFTRQALLPPPPGLPTLRAFQAAQAVIARAWVAERLGLPMP